MMKRLVRFIRGSVRARVVCNVLPQVLAAARRAGVTIFHLKGEDAQTVTFSVYEKDAAALRKICQRYGAELSLRPAASVRGAGRLFRRRPGLAAGGLLAIALLGASACFIWEVDVTGCEEKVTETEVARKLEALGIRRGAFRFGIDASAVENEFLLDNKDVIWMSVNLRFTTARIELRERQTPLKIYDTSTPCDIIAARDGVIRQMMVTSGTPLVKEGDAVRSGQMLISRRHVSKYGEESDVCSLATVTAETQREMRTQAPLTREIHTPTGKSRTFVKLNFVNFKIPLYFKEKIEYNEYDKSESISVWRIGKWFALPVSFEKVRYVEVTVSREKVDRKEAVRLARGKLESLKKIHLTGCEILSETISETEENDTLVLTGKYTCLEDIALSMGG